MMSFSRPLAESAREGAEAPASKNAVFAAERAGMENSESAWSSVAGWSFDGPVDESEPHALTRTARARAQTLAGERGNI